MMHGQKNIKLCVVYVHVWFDMRGACCVQRHLVLPCIEQTLYEVKIVKAFVQLFFSMAQQPVVGQDLPIIKASRSHSVVLHWTRDQPDAETYTLQKHNTRKIQTDIHAHGGIRTHQSQQGRGLRATL